MTRDPFAPLTRKQRQRALVLRAQRLLVRAKPGALPAVRRDGPPSLVAIGVDTLRRDHVTPALMPEVLGRAAGGVDLADVMAPAPWTLPSFAGALTGLMPSRHGARLRGEVRNMDRQPPERLQPGTVTLARHLAGRGWRTAAFYANQFFAFGLAESFQEHRYLNLRADDLLDVALAWLRRHAHEPCFCFVLLNDPHEPTTPPPDLLRPELAALESAGITADPRELRHLAAWGDPAHPQTHLGLCGWPLSDQARRARDLKRAIYRATVRQVDRAVGRFCGQLERHGLAARTQITVFSDHGEEFCDHAAEAHAWGHDPRRVRGIGHGHTQFQELLHVPWLSWGPGVPALGRVDAPVSLLDLAPTLADWLGAGPFHRSEGAVPGLCGQSLAVSTTDGGATDPRVRLAESIAFGPDVVAIRKQQWKLIAHRDGRVLGLYDLAADPRERDDRHAASPLALKDLQEVLARWRAAVPPAGERKGDQKPGGWGQVDDEVRRRLKDLGYGD